MEGGLEPWKGDWNVEGGLETGITGLETGITCPIAAG